LLTLNNVTYEIAGVPLFSNVNWQLKPGDRVGLIGKNGAGKSTLLKLITDEYSPTTGSIAIPNNTKLGYLNQDLLSLTSDDSILNVALTAFEKEMALEKEIEAILVQMESDYTDELGILLAEKQDAFNTMDGYSIQSKTEKVLEGLGFRTERLIDAFSSFSGGWRMRVILAKILLQQPDVLLLDEPTNHLDMPAIEWLESYLLNYQGAVVIVSHDRTFLDKMVNSIGELWNRKFYHYPGNFSNYLLKKDEWLEHSQKVYDNQQTFIKQQERFIERFKAKASKAKQAQSRVKALEKLDRVDAIEGDEASMTLKFTLDKKSGKEVVQAKSISKAYDKAEIFNNTDFTIHRGQKIAIIGANGKGKSTLLKILNNHIEFEGELKLGHNVVPSFFAQHQLEALTLKHEILEELQHAASQKTELELRTILGCFLFTGDDVFKKIKVLSGGEKARVALAKTLVSGANFLLLDEPTNHLDMQSINILGQALKSYEGTVIMVSHDRYFIQAVADEIWWIEDEQVKVYPGDFAEFTVFENERKANIPTGKGKKEKLVKAVEKPKLSNEEFQKQKESEKLRRKKEKQLSDTENQIDTIKSKLKTFDEQIEKCSYDGKFDEIEPLMKERKSLEQDLDIHNEKYELLFEEILAL
jgi:ATP-binding cassette subfamily F protein 3